MAVVVRAFVLYVLRCSDGSLYTGHTDDLQSRMRQHDAGEGCEYTRDRRPVELIWTCEFGTRQEAFERERQIKRWSAAKKRALIEGDWAKLCELAVSTARRH